MGNKIKRFYIMPEVWVTVSHSQVFNWIKLVNEHGISTDCISITNQQLKKEEISKIEESIHGKFTQIRARKLGVVDLFLFFHLLRIYTKNINKYDKIIFQTRISSLGVTFWLLKKLPRVKLIFESRAATIEEREHTSKNQIKGIKVRSKAVFYKWSEKSMLLNANSIICVSDSLKRYYLNKYNRINNNNIIVFPGAADSSLFYYDERIRIKTRRELNIKAEEILYVYSGRLEMKWEIPDKLVEFFNFICTKKAERVKLLLLTPDIKLATTLIEKNHLVDSVIIRSCGLKEVNKYLNASDLALLLREDCPMNNVASPTKFAEYLMAGLPVVISRGIHDFAEIIKRTKFGIVASDLNFVSPNEYAEIMNALKIEKRKISHWGTDNLSKMVFINNYVNLLINL
jgi:glycosyltransferase involved in cell wall biosynthesis